MGRTSRPPKLTVARGSRDRAAGAVCSIRSSNPRRLVMSSSSRCRALAEARQRLRCGARRPHAPQRLHLLQPRFASDWPLEAHECGQQSFRCLFPVRRPTCRGRGVSRIRRRPQELIAPLIVAMRSRIGPEMAISTLSLLATVIVLRELRLRASSSRRRRARTVCRRQRQEVLAPRSAALPAPDRAAQRSSSWTRSTQVAAPDQRPADG